MRRKVLPSYKRKQQRVLVSEFRRNLKLKCIEYKGGKCERCGYNKCPGALTFHHLDPSEKDFGLATNGHSRSFEKCKPELDKCIMVCANCHSELHAEEYKITRDKKLKDLELEQKYPE